jgi:hypothetical protein
VIVFLHSFFVRRLSTSAEQRGNQRRLTKSVPNLPIFSRQLKDLRRKIFQRVVGIEAFCYRSKSTYLFSERVISTTLGVTFCLIESDDSIRMDKMKNRLGIFYLKTPEIVDSRFKRNAPSRNVLKNGSQVSASFIQFLLHVILLHLLPST